MFLWDSGSLSSWATFSSFFQRREEIANTREKEFQQLKFRSAFAHSEHLIGDRRISVCLPFKTELCLNMWVWHKQISCGIRIACRCVKSRPMVSLNVADPYFLWTFPFKCHCIKADSLSSWTQQDSPIRHSQSSFDYCFCMHLIQHLP